MTSTGPAPAELHEHRADAERPVTKHRPALDGIRALAIILVMVYHATDQKPQGGFFSVDVFFVLSGYLIIGLLVDEHQKWGSIDLAAFYVRRARRLLGGLVLAVLGIALITPIFIDDHARSVMREDGIATLFYYANWLFIYQGESYFAQFGDPSPYRQMWTLSIEEQFYIVLPIIAVVVLTVTGGSRRALMWTMVGLAAVSAVWMMMLYTEGASAARIYYGTDTRAQDLLLGSALAIAIRLLPKGFLPKGRATWLGVGALAVMATLVLGFNEFSPFTYRGGFTTFVIATCVLIAAVELEPDGPVARVLGQRNWAWIGVTSYGLYLWHWPIFVVLTPERTHIDGIALFVLRFALSIAAGAVSYYLVENPIRLHGLKPVIGRVGAIVTGLAVLPVSAILLVAILPPASAFPDLTGETGEAKTLGTMDPNAPIRVLIVGDSVGFAVGFAFPQAEYPNVSVVGDVIFGCGTAEQHLAIDGDIIDDANAGNCDDVFGSWSADVAANNPNVVLWSLGGWEVFDHVVDGEVLTVSDPEYADYLRSRLEMGLAQLGPDVQVVIPNVPCYNQPSYVVSGHDLAPDRNDPARGEAINDILDDFAADHENVHIADVASQVCPNGEFTERIDGVQIRDDGVHYTPAGAPYFWEWVMPTIVAAVGS